MSSYDWPQRFKKVWDAASKRYHAGERNPQKLFSKSELEFLGSIGCAAQELFDFIDDGVRYGEPSFETTLLMTDQPEITPTRTRGSGVVVPHKPKWHAEIAALGMWAFGRTLSATWRVRVRNEMNAPSEYPGPFIAAIWHNRLALAMPVWKWWQKSHQQQNLAALISASRDGDLLSRTFSY